MQKANEYSEIDKKKNWLVAVILFIQLVSILFIEYRYFPLFYGVWYGLGADYPRITSVYLLLHKFIYLVPVLTVIFSILHSKFGKCFYLFVLYLSLSTSILVIWPLEALFAPAMHSSPIFTFNSPPDLTYFPPNCNNHAKYFLDISTYDEPPIFSKEISCENIIKSQPLEYFEVFYLPDGKVKSSTYRNRGKLLLQSKYYYNSNMEMVCYEGLNVLGVGYQYVFDTETNEFVGSNPEINCNERYGK